jgi:hypothetical protein
VTPLELSIFAGRLGIALDRLCEAAAGVLRTGNKGTFYTRTSARIELQLALVNARAALAYRSARMTPREE